MVVLIKPITKSASLRAAAADPNGRRCLVENCSKQKAIQLAHVFKRENSTNQGMMRSLEWNWGMRKNTLNLDTKGNTFFVGASLHELYKGRKWMLLPEESAVYQYYEEDKIVPLTRARFVKSEANQFRYTMVPVQNMDDIYLTRQSRNPDTITIHDYPFESLPILTSHISPRYAILQVGDVVYRDIRLPEKRALYTKYPILRKIDILYTRWTGALGDAVEKNTSFVPVPLASKGDQELPDRNLSSSGDSVHTPLRRISPIRTPQIVRPSASSSTSSSSRSTSVFPHATSSAPPHMLKSHGDSSKKRLSHDGKVNHERTKRKKLMLLTCEALEMLEDELEESDSEDDVGWSVERISSWAQGCISSKI